jgi:sugar phosphate isomerase/epimerase
VTQTRRAFLATLATGVLGAATGQRIGLAARPPQRRLARVGVQLYTIRTEMQRDLPATLARVAGIGYKDVEFAGYFNRPAAEVRELLATNGLASPSTHVGFEALQGDAGKRMLDDAKAIGHEYVTVPSPPRGPRATPDDWRRIAESFNRAAADAKAAGLRFAYHNHDAELRPVGGTPPLDVLLANTDPALVDFEMDVYWVVRGGGDPFAYFARFPNRFTMIHAKDAAGENQAMVDVGAGAIDWKRILSEGARAGVKHVFVEHDRPADAFASIGNSYRYLSNSNDLCSTSPSSAPAPAAGWQPTSSRRRARTSSCSRRDRPGTLRGATRR